MVTLRLKKGRSYTGAVTATREKPEVDVKDEAVADKLVASGFFERVGSKGGDRPRQPGKPRGGESERATPKGGG